MNNRKSGSVVSALLILALLFLSALSVLFTAQLVTLQSFSDTFFWIGSHILPSAVTITALVVIEALFYGLFGKLFIAFLLTGIPSVLLACVSYYKSVINGFPLLISDLAFSENISDIVSFALPQIKITIPTVCGLLLLPITAIFLFLADRKIRVAFFPKRMLLAVPAGILTACFFLTGIFITPAAGAAWDLSQEERIDQMGISLAFYSAYAVSWKEKNEGYDGLIDQIKAEVQEKNASESSGGDKPSSVSPTVILLMSESFLTFPVWME